jgi:hypothetical protein
MGWIKNGLNKFLKKFPLRQLLRECFSVRIEHILVAPDGFPPFPPKSSVFLNPSALFSLVFQIMLLLN